MLESGVSLWADAAEFAPGDLFEIQDQIVRHIVTRIAPHIREEELRRAMRRKPESMTAYDRTLQALHLMDYMDKDMFGQARDVLAQAMSDDPNFAMPVAWSVWWHIIWVGQGWSTDPASRLRSRQRIGRARDHPGSKQCARPCDDGASALIHAA